MATHTANNSDFRFYKTAQGGKTGFVDLNDTAALEQLCNYCDNTDTFISACSYRQTNESSECYYPLYIVLNGNSINDIRGSAIEAIYWLAEQTGTGPEQMDIYYSGTSPNNKMEIVADSSAQCTEITIYIHHSIFGAVSTQQVPMICFNLARQMTRDNIKNIAIDVYERNHYLRLPNSKISSLGCYMMPLQLKELTFLNDTSLSELSKQPRPADSYAVIQPNPQAQDWLSIQNSLIEEEIKRQNRLLESILKTGWQIPPCINRLLNLYLYDNVRLEAYRISCAYLAWIKASAEQIFNTIQAMDIRNPVNDYQLLKAITAFAVENPRFAGCEHPLLEKSCPAGRCFMAELIENIRQPSLFDDL